MADLNTLIQEMRADGTLEVIALNPAAQFGRGEREYLGASLLPERIVMENAFTDNAIRFQTMVANAGSRYSPVQLKRGEMVASFLVVLGDSDIGREFTSRDYDSLLMILAQDLSMDAMVTLINWLDTSINQALVVFNEVQRWQAIVDSEVVRLGDNGYSELVEYANPAGHRVAASDTWSDDTFDPFTDIFTMAAFLASKGLTCRRIITSTTVVSILAGNDKVKTRTGLAVVNQNGQIVSANGQATIETINGVLRAQGLPAIETYDLQYRTQTGTEFFLARDVFVMIAGTERSAEIDLGDDEEILMIDGTLGYVAVGRAAGQQNSGRVIRMEGFDNKPPRIEGEGWQTSLPVINEPEAIVVILEIA